MRYLARPPAWNHPALGRAFLHELAGVGPPPPPAADLRPFYLPVRNQFNEGCCSGFSTAALREGVLAMLHGPSSVQYLSPAYLYARTRMTEGSFPADVGAVVADELTTLKNFGACLESQLPYTANPTEAPTPECDAAAQAFRIPSFAQVQTSDPLYLEAAISGGQAVVFAMDIRPSFERTGPDGMVPDPAPGEQSLGGHAMLAVGYDRSSGRLTVRNSWSSNWGSGGYCFLPYSLISSFFEAWTIPLA